MLDAIGGRDAQLRGYAKPLARCGLAGAGVRWGKDRAIGLFCELSRCHFKL
jgi:hypothetical protein